MTGTEKRPLDKEVVAAVRQVLGERSPDGLPFTRILREDRTALLADIKTLLETQQSAVRCRFSQAEADGLTAFLTTPGERKEPLRDLRRWLQDAKRLVIADPYFMHGDASGWRGLSETEKKGRAEQYADEVRRVLGGVAELDLFHLPDPPKHLQTAMKKISFKSRKVRRFATTEVHDRIWIKDGYDALIIGTSFGGIGRKLAFMIELPEDDRTAFQTQLERIRQG